MLFLSLCMHVLFAGLLLQTQLDSGKFNLLNVTKGKRAPRVGKELNVSITAHVEPRREVVNQSMQHMFIEQPIQLNYTGFVFYCDQWMKKRNPVRLECLKPRWLFGAERVNIQVHVFGL